MEGGRNPPTTRSYTRCSDDVKSSTCARMRTRVGGDPFVHGRTSSRCWSMSVARWRPPRVDAPSPCAYTRGGWSAMCTQRQLLPLQEVRTWFGRDGRVCMQVQERGTVFQLMASEFMSLARDASGGFTTSTQSSSCIAAASATAHELLRNLGSSMLMI